MEKEAVNASLTNIYSKTSLRVNLHRSSAIVPGREFLDLDFGITDYDRMGTFFEMSSTNTDTVILVDTASNVFTKIITGKFVTYDSLFNKTDSIKCVNGANSIDVYY